MNRIVRLDTMIGLFIVFIVTSLSPYLSVAQVSDIVVITNGLIIDGTGAEPFTDHVLVIEENRIIGIFPREGYVLPADAMEINANGGTVLPGLFNAHVHDTASLTVRRRDFVEYGVTSVCDAGSQLSTVDYFEREYTNENERVARGFRSGPFITAPNGYPDIYYQTQLNYEVEGVDEARLATLDLIDRGVDYIKVAFEPGTEADNWALLSDAELNAIIDTSH